MNRESKTDIKKKKYTQERERKKERNKQTNENFQKT